MKLLLSLLALLGVMLLIPAPAIGQRTGGQADPAQVKADLRKILEQPEFQPEKQSEGILGRFSRWWEAKKAQFQAWLRRLIGDRKPSEARNPTSGISSAISAVVIPLITALLLLAVVWLIAILVRAIARNWKGKEKKAAKTTTTFDIDDATADMMEEPDEWLRQAQQFAAASDFRRAFRAVFLGVLLQMDQAGAIEYSRYRTNGDYLRLMRMRGLSALFEAFLPLVFEFDLRWYGNHATAEEDYRRCRQEYDRIRKLLATPTTQPAPSMSASVAA